MLGNRAAAPALEFTAIGPRLRFHQAADVCVTGGEFAMRRCEVMRVAAGEEMNLGAARRGLRGYLCVRGGLAPPHAIPPFRQPVHRGQTVGLAKEPPSVAAPPIPYEWLLARPARLRITPSAQTSWFSAVAWRILISSTFRVSPDSNRQGIRLSGPHLEICGREMLTEGVCLGAIQVPPDGQPVILFVDQQTTGGYPKIANVILADTPIVGQLRPGDLVCFQPVSFEEAVAAWRARMGPLLEPG